MIIHLIVGFIKKILLLNKMIPIIKKLKVELGFTNYKIEPDLKNATGVNTSDFA